MKGGTPAIENSSIDMFNNINVFCVNSLNVYKVFSFIVKKLSSDQKNDIRDRL